MNTLFTIGHSNHEPDRFLSLLGTNGIISIADVRSNPYSKYVPQYSKDNLQQLLRTAGIEYLFLGRELGARREEEACYVDDQAQYARIAQLHRFKAGIERVVDESRGRPTALMCSEGDPLTCHRTILVCREILRVFPGMHIDHILPDGTLEPHDAAIDRLIALHHLEPELFGELSSREGLVERAYEAQGARIAFTRSVAGP